MKIDVGDLVRVRGKDWLGKPLGIVTEVKRLVHDQSGVEYTAITAVVGGSAFTFSERDFELVNSAERKKN
jgi:hypothetical protein|tara:strand:- start:4774 stop:4983 length:210 start_codon:yes stop_codon:yes gene_type:complete